jgi:hypothetical protein
MAQKAHLISHYRVTSEEFANVNLLTEGLSEVNRKLFCHILVATLLRLSGEKDSLWIPVYSKLIWQNLRGASWKALVARELIQATGYSKAERRSREYQVTSPIIDTFLECTQHLTAEDKIACRYVDLLSGRAMNKADVNDFCDENGNQIGGISRDAANQIWTNGTTFKRSAVEQHIELRKKDYLAAKKVRDIAWSLILELGLSKKAAQAEFEKQFKQEIQDYFLAHGRWQNDRLAFDFVLKQKPIQLTEELWMYRACYKPTMSGRITHKQGGFQSCSKEMKYAAFNGVPDFYNYDLKSSQINGAIQALEFAQLDAGWLKEYRDTSNNKQVYAAKCQMPVKVWKNCLITLLMGGYLPANLEDLDEGKISILKYMSKACNGNVAEVEAMLGRFRTIVLPLSEVLSKWHKWLKNEYVPAIQYRGGTGCKSWFVRNQAGRTLNVTETFSKHKHRTICSKLAAFFLQGIESAFIHHLTMLGVHYGYKAVFNDHDGLGSLEPVMHFENKQ